MQQLLKDIDRTKFRVWALTNAYYNVSLLSLCRKEGWADLELNRSMLLEY